MSPKITGVLLAAGRGSRYYKKNGHCKLTAQLASQELVIQASFRHLSTIVDEVVVVTGYWRKAVNKALINDSYREVYVAHHDEGIGTSIKAAINNSAPSIGWLLTLGDMPFIGLKDIAAVAASLAHGALITRPYYGDIPGHPVGVSCHLRDQLLNLPSDKGVKAIIESAQDQLVKIETFERETIIDIDQPDDLILS